MLKLSELRKIPDRRRGQGKMYDLPYVLICCILAIVSGAQSYRGIARFIKTKFWWLQEHIGLPWRQAPVHTGLRAILLGLDQEAVEQALRKYATDVLANAETGSTIAIDGKTLRGSIDQFADVAALQWLSAFATDERIVIGQLQIADGDKGGEISAAQRLIEELGLQGKLFTLDALHCQKNSASRCRLRQRRVGSAQRQPTHSPRYHGSDG